MTPIRDVPLVALLSCLLLPLSLSLPDNQKITSDTQETAAGAGLPTGAEGESVTSPYNDEESASRDVIYSEQGNISGLLLTEMQLPEEVLREPGLAENLKQNSSEGVLTEKSGQGPLTEAHLARQQELASLQGQVYVVGVVGGALLLLLLLSTVILAVIVRKIHRKLGKISRERTYKPGLDEEKSYENHGYTRNGAVVLTGEEAGHVDPQDCSENMANNRHCPAIPEADYGYEDDCSYSGSVSLEPGEEENSDGRHPTLRPHFS